MDKLEIKAGRKALALIKKEGLTSDMVYAMAGAAGGPKWIVLGGIDRYLFGDFFAERRRPLHLIASSIGAWRFAAAMASPDPLEGLTQFKDIYFQQFYSEKVVKQEVTETAHRLIKELFTPQHIEHILQHPYGRLQITTALSSPLSRNEKSVGLSLSIMGSMIANAMHRSFLQPFYQRVIFRNQRDCEDLFDDPYFNTAYVPLRKTNFLDAILASSSIPMVMEPIQGIEGAPKGVYRDGGIIDYHMLHRYQCPENQLVLLPHFFEQYKQGWFDKHLSYRKPRAKELENVVMIYLTKAFIDTLPNQKVPDRKDFTAFSNEERNRLWAQAYEQSLELGHELQRLIESGKIVEVLSPI